ncbi:hypothetical protein E4U32_000810 [Claviceps aff. humidiphila group G2b]|uniref:Cyclin-like protein CLG1 n=1 Tax=Claviceps arundinis TaxID=1623583 RepID=A0A9P7MN10_9HYPO|nr:hypothetical protein E4U57_004972 [Claviceps arundinis]KAG5959730.1 hypothetical protein E4U56_004793 [Claviceps arundinis]KAG6063841.1 hypothetical protein E4U32_000810 [Claviceps aff. humidiphila group G2b]
MPGGVCAVLDYDIDLMADYVAEMAVRVVTPDGAVTSAFRKFVAQILTSTRLPSTTILLGMNYLAKRMNAMRGQGACKVSEGQIWRYLTVSLLLGSKFLDDNTFQNRSWSEVSGIAVSELNSLEFEWVQAMSWKLYVNLDVSKDYKAWLENWREWQQLKKRRPAQPSRVRPVASVPALDTPLAKNGSNRQSPHSRYLQAQIAEYERYQAIKGLPKLTCRPRETVWPHNPWSAPLTPPDSGYGTPEHVTSTTSTNAHYSDWFAQATAQYSSKYNSQYSSRYPQPPAVHNTFYQHRQTPLAPQYAPNHTLWDRDAADCTCSACAAPTKQTPYFAYAYGQLLVG